MQSIKRIYKGISPAFPAGLFFIETNHIHTLVKKFFLVIEKPTIIHIFLLQHYRKFYRKPMDEETRIKKNLNLNDKNHNNWTHNGNSFFFGIAHVFFFLSREMDNNRQY